MARGSDNLFFKIICQRYNILKWGKIDLSIYLFSTVKSMLGLSTVAKYVGIDSIFIY
jgi:hypothetical protein